MDILAAIVEEEDCNRGAARISRLQARVYLNWGALAKHLAELQRKQHVMNGDLRVTERGRRFLEIYRTNIAELLQTYGFS